MEYTLSDAECWVIIMEDGSLHGAGSKDFEIYVSEKNALRAMREWNRTRLTLQYPSIREQAVRVARVGLVEKDA